LEPGDAAAASDPLEEVIVRRGSTRRFSRAPITFAELSTVLRCSLGGVAADFLSPGGTALNDVYLIVNSVDGLPPGAYFYHRDVRALELLKEGEFRGTAGHLGLDQELPRDASIDVFFLANLGGILAGLGNRGYRAAQLDASIAAGRMYLAAHALGLGATGLTFYDDEVTEFFSPHALGQSPMFMMAVGRRAVRRRTAERDGR
jgi:SagB-type dehydrogenase family enzyme